MNNLLRSKGNIDVAAGFLSFFSELKVHNDAIDGYVKVLFRDIDIYDKAQDKHKPVMNKVKEFVADGLADLLQNRGTEEVATKARVSGPLENPNTSIWEIIGKLVQNAFFKAILPGLDTSGDADTNVASGITSEPSKAKDTKDEGSKDDDKGRLRRWIDKHRAKDKD